MYCFNLIPIYLFLPQSPQNRTKKESLNISKGFDNNSRIQFPNVLQGSGSKRFRDDSQNSVDMAEVSQIASHKEIQITFNKFFLW
jgi:hypothetical protein